MRCSKYNNIYNNIYIYIILTAVAQSSLTQNLGYVAAGLAYAQFFIFYKMYQLKIGFIFDTHMSFSHRNTIYLSIFVIYIIMWT